MKEIENFRSLKNQISKVTKKIHDCGPNRVIDSYTDQTKVICLSFLKEKKKSTLRE
jgi:hypothetical protein